jgi:myo-inositol-1(or 4)-monophosphatase
MTHPVLNVAVEAAHAAATIMRRQLQRVEAIPVERKARHDYVSEVDRACEAEIVREIKRFYPDHAFLCEESGSSGESDCVWVIDPLDGTSNFLHGLPHFAISIALEERGELVAGVVFDPSKDELYYAERGAGAFLNDRRIRVSSRSRLDDALIATGIPFKGHGDTAQFVAELNAVSGSVAGVRRWGTASLDLAYVAAGRYDGYWERDLSSWDIAAGIVLVREAGGTVSEIGAKPIRHESASILAGNESIHPALNRLLRGAAASPG